MMLMKLFWVCLISLLGQGDDKSCCNEDERQDDKEDHLVCLTSRGDLATTGAAPSDELCCRGSQSKESKSHVFPLALISSQACFANWIMEIIPRQY